MASFSLFSSLFYCLVASTAFSCKKFLIYMASVYSGTSLHLKSKPDASKNYRPDFIFGSGGSVLGGERERNARVATTDGEGPSGVVHHSKPLGHFHKE
jgi:hypothetical protein